MWPGVNIIPAILLACQIPALLLNEIAEWFQANSPYGGNYLSKLVLRLKVLSGSASILTVRLLAIPFISGNCLSL